MSGAPLTGLEEIFGWLLTASWQASVLALLVLGLQGALGARLNPRWRYALWLLVLVRLLLPFQMESALSLFQFAPAPPAALEAPMTQPLFSTAPASGALSPVPVVVAPPVIALSLDALVALVWLAGVAILGTLTFEVNRRFVRQVAQSPEVSDPVILALFAEAKAEFRTRRAIRLVESAQVGSPAIMGLFRPTLLLPARVRATFDPAELRLIFLHELAHLKRGDVVVQGFIALLQILHWFNPVLWFAFRRMRADREPAADALVLSRAGEGEKERYGLMLLKLLEHFQQRHALPTLVGILEDKDPFKRRFLLIARFTRGAYGWSMLGFLLIVALGFACLTKSKAAQAPSQSKAGALESSVASAREPGVKFGITFVEIDEKAYEQQSGAIDEAVQKGDAQFFFNKNWAAIQETSVVLLPGQPGWYSEGEVRPYIGPVPREYRQGKSSSAKTVFLGINADFGWSKDKLSFTSKWAVTAPVGFDKLTVSPGSASGLPNPYLAPKIDLATYTDKNWDMAAGTPHGFWIGESHGALMRGSGMKTEPKSQSAYDVAVADWETMIKAQRPTRLAVLMTAQKDSPVDQSGPLLPPFRLEPSFAKLVQVGGGTTRLTDSSAHLPNPGMAAADLSGTVQDEKGQPISGATVQIYTAGMRSGSSPICPSCWPDCAKNAKTDSQGNFHIKNVSGQLVFRLLIVATGFEPAFLQADPQKGAAQVRLKARDLGAFHDKQIIEGTVVGPDSKPVAGAIVTTEFNQESLDPVAVTDEAGKFIFTCAHDIPKNYLTFRAAGYAPFKLVDVAGGSPPLQITLTHGVVISGRVLEQGRPIAGIGIGIVQTERGRPDKWVGPQTTVTDANGAFHFYNAVPRSSLEIYGLMSSLAGQGAIPVRVIQTGVDDSTLPVGDLAIVPAGEIKGRFHEIDGKPFPPGTRVGIGRDAAWDQQLVDVGADGSFHASGFPFGEKLSVWAPRDHQIQKVNSGFEIDPLNSRVTGTFSHALSDLEIDLVAKDEKTQRAERDVQQANEHYGAFFAREKFTPDQVKLFVADQLEQRRVYVKASEGGSSYSQAQRQGNEAMQKLLTDKFGAKVCGDYVDFENLREGLIVVSWFYSPPQDHWLTEDEKEKLALVLWPIEEKVDENVGAKLTKKQKIAEVNYFIGRFQIEGEKVLPEAKHAAYEQALAKFKQILLQIENDGN